MFARTTSMNEWQSLVFFAVVALLLLIADRYYRIGVEGYENMPVPAQRCGVDMPPCAYPTICGNGVCIAPGTKILGERDPLPVV